MKATFNQSMLRNMSESELKTYSPLHKEVAEESVRRFHGGYFLVTEKKDYNEGYEDGYSEGYEDATFEEVDSGSGEI